MRFFVVSNAGSRRTTYFIQAGESVGADVRFVTYEALLLLLPRLQEAVIKLEPEVYSETGFAAYARLCAAGMHRLERLGRMEKAPGVRFMNEPDAILLALDKVRCKEALTAAGLRCTPIVAHGLTGFDALAACVAARPRGVFVKPRYGSGAGGIMAIRYQPRLNRWMAYTTLYRGADGVHNTGRIHRLTGRDEIAFLAETVLREGALVEEWVAKESAAGEPYDLRVVCVGGRAVYVVVRYSSGAITNLHLNNKPGRWDDLQLPAAVREEVLALGVAATRAAGLYYAGVDVLLEKGSLRPCVIEVNGQGDHIYQDLFGENSIYRGEFLFGKKG